MQKYFWTGQRTCSFAYLFWNMMKQFDSQPMVWSDALAMASPVLSRSVVLLTLLQLRSLFHKLHLNSNRSRRIGRRSITYQSLKIIFELPLPKKTDSGIEKLTPYSPNSPSKRTSQLALQNAKTISKNSPAILILSSPRHSIQRIGHNQPASMADRSIDF